MENEDKEKKKENRDEPIHNAKQQEANDKIQSKAEDGYDKKELEEETEQSTTTTCIRHRSFKKPKPYFYIGGCNGAHLVEEQLLALGWERITDKSREDFKLKWCEIKSHNNYHSFREGEQLCYQIPNNKLLTTKIGLLISLQEYDRVMNKVKKGNPKIMKYQDFFPETYRLDIKDDRELFFETYVDNEVWISKPTGLNQGKGIYLLRSRDDIRRLQEKIAEILEDASNSRKLPFKVPMARIVQRYVENPLLLEGKKFDVRNYLLIACTNPLVVFYADGYCRLTCVRYDRNSTDLTGHLTNQFMQKKNPLYEEVKEDTVWSMDRFNDYVNEKFASSKDLPEDWVHTVLRKRCQQIMLHCFQAVRHKLECRLGFFDLIGCDFLIHEDFKISLLEMNCNPALHTNCDALKEIMPHVVGETLKHCFDTELALEIFEKATKRERIMPLTAQRRFVLLYNGDSIEAAERRERMQSAAEARRRARSAQRRKRFNPSQFVYKRTINNSTTATVTTTTTTASSSSQTFTSLSQTNSSPSQQKSVSPPISASASSPPTSSTVASVSLCRNCNLPSSTVTALTMSSQQRVTKSKNKPNDGLKPFYAGGTVATSRPFSAPKVNRKYAQVESKVMSHHTLYSLESSRRDSINNAALQAASNSKIVNYVQKAKSVLLTPKREDITELRDPEIEYPLANHLDVDPVRDEREEIDALDRENLFEQILEEPDEIEIDEENEDEEDDELINIGNSPSPEMMRRPSAKLPLHYHSSFLQSNLLSGASSWPRYQCSPHIVQKKTPRTASLSVRSSTELPLPYIATPYQNFRPSNDLPNKTQYRAPTTVRIKQSLPGTTCTLEIGPKSRRGLIAVSTGKLTFPNSGEIYTTNRKLNPPPRLKLINSNHAVAEINSELPPPSALVHLTANHLPKPIEEDAPIMFNGGNIPATGSLVHGAVPMHYSTALPSNQVQIKHVELNNVKLKTDSSTQTTHRSNAPLTSEEKVIWRLRSRICDSSLRSSSDGGSTTLSQITVRNQKVPIKVVTQSPGLISPKRVPDPLLNRRVVPVPRKNLINSNNPACASVPLSPTKSFRLPADLPSSLNEKESRSSVNVDLARTGMPNDKPTALSKVVAIATSVPTRARSNENKVKESNGFGEEPTLLTAG